MSTHYSGVGTFYLACSQCCELECEYKESSRKRVTRFDCHGKIIINIDIPAKEAMVRFCHEIQYELPINITIAPEVKYEIMQNLHMDPIQLRIYLRQIFDISLVTTKQIHYW
ncbi:3989_t:CDS:1 [Acaulospora morrowiae]|uniref:3989_t:CDS:1 n=1 Tax=Acaulospora morrowiae TaxID=94023 RepID=A0A9N8VZU7_9GLOM|nr:3989_t:CDS:1 [Acaulospora morrowiae]